MGEQGVELMCHEPKTVHSGVKLYVDRIVLQSSFGEDFLKGKESRQVRDARFETVVHYLIEEIHPCRKDQNRQTDAGLAQFDSLQRQSNCQIVSPRVLHHRGELHCAMPIGIGLDEHQHPGGAFKLRPEIPVVVKAIGKIQLEP